ncbi:hypothetical protein [Erythrobacter sp. JK5]|uniref:hypothetical protein n=1 Tax=Erythrobacter sp. JK5 TaxID=2829500 RepID=UPI001BAC410E|nr:hypothetical protein [Erythrobacter sp. JK5]QUL38535.1 hypothetical protein KDC96_03815 [Erythrobacter sp. JK5]
MPISLFELIMGWVFLLAIVLGVVTVIVGLRQEGSRAKLLHFAVAVVLPISAWALLQIGSAIGL